MLCRGNEWESLLNEGVSLIMNRLLDNQPVWLIDTKGWFGESLLEHIRDSLLERLNYGNLQSNQYEESLARLYLYPDLRTASEHSEVPCKKPLVVNLSVSWHVEC